MPETMKLFGCFKNEITKDENGENVPHSVKWCYTISILSAR